MKCHTELYLVNIMQCDGEMDCAEGLDEWDVLCSKSDKLFYCQHMSNSPFPSQNWSNSRKKGSWHQENRESGRIGGQTYF